MAHQVKPQLLLLSLPDSPIPFSAVRRHYVDVLEELSDIYNLIETTEGKKAIEEMASASNLAAVLVVDAAITKPNHRNLALILALYARAGGTVVLGGAFADGVGPPDLNRFFQLIWDLPWRYGYFDELDWVTNSDKMVTTLSEKISWEDMVEFLVVGDQHTGLRLANVKLLDQIYRCRPEEDWGMMSNTSPAAVTKVGRGLLGYVGFINAQDWLAPVYLALCELGLSSSK